MGFSAQQLDSFQLAERIGASLSVVGCATIVISFCGWPAFRKPIRTLIFYASFGNLLSAVGILIGHAGVEAGINSALCQLQAFFIQQWIPADALWAFCMALNLYLSIYRRHDAEQLRGLEKWYFLGCYGVPLILSLTLFFIKTEERGRMYGPAGIWCSISDSWGFMRLACFYGPVWLVVLATFTIYVVVGRDIFQKSRALSGFTDVSSNAGSGDQPNAKSVTIEITGSDERESHLTPYTVQVESHEPFQQPRDAKEHRAKAAIVTYGRYSFVFFVALVVTWLPSSINRIVAVVKPDADLFGLNLVGALVLSLQGFWNAIIYFTTCVPYLKSLWSKFKTTIPPSQSTQRQAIPLYNRPFDGTSISESIATLTKNSR